MNIEQQWDIFKLTWLEKVDKTELNLYNEFNHFITSELQKFKNNNNNNSITVKRIFISNTPVNSITLKENSLYIYESPFYVNYYGMKYPSAFLVEDIILSIIKYIEKNSLSTIIVTRLHNSDNKENEDEDDEDEDEEEEEEEENRQQ